MRSSSGSEISKYGSRTMGEASSFVETTATEALTDGALLISITSTYVEQNEDCAPLEPVVGISFTVNVTFRRELLLFIDVEENETCFNAMTYEAAEAAPERKIPHPFEVIELNVEEKKPLSLIPKAVKFTFSSERRSPNVQFSEITILADDIKSDSRSVRLNADSISNGGAISVY